MSAFRRNRSPKPPTDSIYDMFQLSTEQVTTLCRSLHDMNTVDGPMSSSSSSSSSSLCPSPVSPLVPMAVVTTQKQLSHTDKLRKVISELVDTEKTYVKDLGFLIDRYLKPLQNKSFLTQEELDILFGNLREMEKFQVEFLQTLEDGIRLVPDLDSLERVEQFKKVLFSLGGSFLYYADRFKIYSAFCASHTKVPKVLAKAKTDPEFKAFLAERNPKQQHSFTLESFLIKPIQRVLKYPLLLRELHSLTDPDSEEHYHLDVAIKTMNKVASHINDMQKLHEEYGAVFDQLINEQSAGKKEVLDLSMRDLLLHSKAVWMNPPASLVKSKKDPELATFVFKTAVVLVFKDTKHRKKYGTTHRISVVDDRDPFRFRHLICTDSLQVPPANSEPSSVCEIVQKKSESEGRPERTFRLCCRSQESKEQLLKAVNSILREKQRRLLLNAKSLPASSQYVPFGGKRLSALKGARPSFIRAASAPSRTLTRRDHQKNRVIIDTDLVLHGNHSCDANGTKHTSYVSSSLPLSSQSQEPQGEDTDRWVEQQFNLGYTEERSSDEQQVKETDILSDEDDGHDEHCKETLSLAEPGLLEAGMEELNLKSKDIHLMEAVEATYEDNRGEMVDGARQRVKLDSTSCSISDSQCAKRALLTQCTDDTVWVRRSDFNKGCEGDVF